MASRPEDNLYAPRWVSSEQEPKSLFTEILPGLFMGGTADDDTIKYPSALLSHNDTSNFDAVVTLYAWANPMSWGVEELRYGFGDGYMSGVNIDRIIRLAHWAHQRWSEGQRVLIRCQAGMNRSGLITALVLMIEGLDAKQAIQLIRKQRSEVCLFNSNFVDWLVTDAANVLEEGLRGEAA